MTGPAAVLVLEDGLVLRGNAFGAVQPSQPVQPVQPVQPAQPAATVFGEMVFNTGMTGYQETLTDPSYHRQIVAMTAPHIGNTGINDEDYESRRIWVAGYVVREPARIASSWRAATQPGRRTAGARRHRHSRRGDPRAHQAPA